MANEEILDIVDHNGYVIGSAPRSKIHGDNALLHKVVHVLVFDTKGRLLLQKRSMKKDVAPGKWDTSVGGHVDSGESTEKALFRELDEELGIINVRPELMYKYIQKNDYETELVYTYKCCYEGSINFNREEIDDICFFSIDEINKNLKKGFFSDNFEDEFSKYLLHSKKVVK